MVDVSEAIGVAVMTTTLGIVLGGLVSCHVDHSSEYFEKGASVCASNGGLYSADWVTFTCSNGAMFRVKDVEVVR